VPADWKHDHNTVRPHSALGNLPPAELRGSQRSRKVTHGALRYVEGSAPHPIGITEPLRLKRSQDSTHRWMNQGAQLKPDESLGEAWSR